MPVSERRLYKQQFGNKSGKHRNTNHRQRADRKRNTGEFISVTRSGQVKEILTFG